MSEYFEQLMSLVSAIGHVGGTLGMEQGIFTQLENASNKYISSLNNTE
jgi:hypothetical protein